MYDLMLKSSFIPMDGGYEEKSENAKIRNNVKTQVYK